MALDFDLVADREAFEALLIDTFKAHVGTPCDLVVYPGLLGLSLWAGEPEHWPTAERSIALWQGFVEGSRQAARRLGACLVPGSMYVRPDEQHLEHRSLLIGSTGQILGETQQTHAAFGHDGPELVLGTQLDPIATPWGKVGLVLGEDVHYPEVGRILALGGADILVHPGAPLHPYSAEQAMSGLWQMCQQNRVYGLESGLRGRLFGARCDGKAAVCGPLERSAEESGFLPTPGYLAHPGAVYVQLRASDLQELEERAPLAEELNTTMYRRRFPKAYHHRVRP